MRVRTLLLASATSIGLFLTASHVPNAHAQKGVFLKPSSQWAVTKVAGNPAAGQAGYCAVAKKYGGDAILTIARNQGSETSFALDLQKPLFNPAQSIAVTLDPGAGEQRDYSISPASAQAFVVRLGRDEAFFNAVDRTGLLRVEVEEQSYVFNIADIGAGQSKLNSCLASSVQPAAGDSLPDLPAQATSVASNSADQEFIATLNARIGALEAENKVLQGKIARFDADPITRAGVDKDTPAALKAEVLKAENLRLKAALQTEVVEQQSEKLKVLQADNARLAAQIDKQSNVSADVAELQSRIDRLLSENVRLENEVSAASSFDTSGLEQDIQQLKRENTSLKTALAEQASSGAGDHLKMRIEQIEQENKSLKEKMLLDKQAAYESEDSDVRDVRQTYNREIAALHAEIEILRLNQSSSATVNEQVDHLNAQLASLRADNLLLQQELFEKGSVIDGAGSNVNIAALDAENKKLQAKIEKSLYAHELQGKAIASLELENAQLKNKASHVNVASSSIDEMEEQLDTLRNQLELSQQKQGAQEQKLAALSVENTELKTALDAQVADSITLASALNDVDVLKQEIAAKDEQLASFEGVPERMQELLTSYRTAQADKKMLEAKIAANSTRQEIAGIEQEAVVAELDAKDSENARLKVQLEEAQIQNKVFEEKLSGLQGSVIAMAKLNEEVKGLHSVLATKEQEIAELQDLRDELGRVLAANETLKEEKSTLAFALEEALGEQSSETTKLASENLELRKTLSSALNKIEGHNDALKAKDNSIGEILAQNETLRGQLDLASDLIADGVEKAKSMVQASLKKEKPEAGVILAAASAPATKKVVPKIEKVKPAKEESFQDSIAEKLADIAPAAGEEDVASEADDGVDKAVEEIVPAQDIAEAPEVVEEAQDFMDRELNQAQIYEEQLKRSLDNQGRIEQSRVEPIEVETLEDNAIDDVIESVATIETDTDELPPLEAISEVEMGAPDADVVEPDESVEIRMAQDPFEGIEAVDEAGESVASTVIEPVKEQVDVAPLPQKTVQPKSAPVRSADSSPASLNAAAIDRVLRLANVSEAGAVSNVDEKDNAYQWRVGGLFGSGEQRVMSSVAQFDGYVKDYLSRTEERCPGDFAIVPDNSKESGSVRVDSYEIACIGSNVSSSASLVFYNDGDVFTVIAHETEADKMDQAMQTRDKIFNSLASGRDS